MCSPRASLFFSWIFALAVAFPAVAQKHDPAAQRVAHLRRGINTSMWFAQWPGDYSVERLRSFTTAEDLALIHSLGFDHIRLSIDADPLTVWQTDGPHGAEFMAELDHVVATATGDGLAVIVDVHPESRYKQELLQGTESVQRFVTLWRALATHFAASDPGLVFFEIMNEPEQSDPVRWHDIEGSAAGVIREAAPRHTIIAAGARWSSLDDLRQLQPLALDNIIYTFHDYEPFPFTHQGATWTMTEVRPLRGVPYPSTPENVRPLLAQKPTEASRSWLEQYGLARWNADRVESSIAPAEQWSKLHHVPVYCGEFGVYRAYALPDDRARWLHDMRTTLERHNIGWAMWDYQAGFGIVTKRDGKTIPDPAIVQALGLHTPK